MLVKLTNISFVGLLHELFLFKQAAQQLRQWYFDQLRYASPSNLALLALCLPLYKQDSFKVKLLSILGLIGSEESSQV